MGISDFQTEAPITVDRVIVISADKASRDSIASLFQKRAYYCAAEPDISKAAERASGELFDLVIYEHVSTTTTFDEALRSIRSTPTFHRTPIIALHPEPQLAGTNLEESAGVQVLGSPCSPGELLVKAALHLRLRKLRAEQLSVDARLAEQNAQLRDLTARFQRELKEAQGIQRTILPKALPEDWRCVFSATYTPLEAVGGDLYDIWAISPGRFGLFLGDVTGHGLPAALIGAMTKMALAYARKDTVSTMLCDLNDGIADHMPEGRFVASTAAIYNAEDGAMQFACAGNPAPLVYRHQSGYVERIPLRGIPVGITSGTPYRHFETVLEPGDKAILTTDGIIETASMDGELLGVDRLADYLAAAGRNTLPECISSILERQNLFAGGRMFKDDSTLLAVERLK